MQAFLTKVFYSINLEYAYLGALLNTARLWSDIQNVSPFPLIDLMFFWGGVGLI